MRRVAVIGPAAEKLSLIAGVVTDGGRIAARSSLGAVMGRKNLKAVAFKGGDTIPVAFPDNVKALNARYMSDFKSKPRLLDKISIRFLDAVSKLISKTGVHFPAEPGTVREIWKRWGTCGTTVYSALIGDMPVRNWGGAGSVDYTVDMADKVSGENLITRQKRKYACQSCPMGCGGIGDILADGVRVAAEKIGRGAEAFAVHAGGQELPMHDSRLDPGYTVA